MKWLAVLILCGLLLNLHTLDNIYVGIRENDQWTELKVIKPDKLNYVLEVPLKENQEAYFFYNLGFGRYTTNEVITNGNI